MGALVRSKRAGEEMMQRIAGGGSKLRDTNIVWFIMLMSNLKTFMHC